MSQMLGGATTPGLGGGMSDAGFTGVTDTGAGYTGAAPVAGIQPGGVTPQGTSDVGQANAMQNAHGGMSTLQKFAMMFGDTPEERTKNARAFSDMVQQLGKMGNTIAQATLLQRMMQGRIRPIAELTPPQSSGGVGAGALSPEQSAGATDPIMSRMGYK